MLLFADHAPWLASWKTLKASRKGIRDAQHKLACSRSLSCQQKAIRRCEPGTDDKSLSVEARITLRRSSVERGSDTRSHCRQEFVAALERQSLCRLLVQHSESYYHNGYDRKAGRLRRTETECGLNDDRIGPNLVKSMAWPW